MKKMQYEVTICEVENGFIVRAGCKLFAFAGYEEMEKELRAYAHGEKTELIAQIEKEAPPLAEAEAQDCLATPSTIGGSVARG